MEQTERRVQSARKATRAHKALKEMLVRKARQVPMAQQGRKVLQVSRRMSS